MAYSTDIKDYYRRAWGLEDRPKSQYAGKYGGSWADWASNYEDQMTFEEYLRDDTIVKKPHILDQKADGGRIGGGIIAGKDLGDRTGFEDPNLVRKEKSIQSYYDIFGKKTLDKISKKKHGKVFSKLEKDNLSNLKRRVTKFKDFILKNNRMPSETEARSLGWSASRTLTDQGIQIRLVEDLKSGTVDINKLAKKYKIPVEELKTHAKRLERNVWKKRMGTSPLKWLSDEGDTLDNVMNSLYKSKLVQYKRDKIEQLFYDAFGDKKSKTYNPKKWAAMRKNWNEYNKLRNSIKEIFPGIKFELDHPLSKNTLRTIFNASGDQLTRVNPMVAEINNGIKKRLDTQYKNAIDNKNLTSKKAIEKIAKDLGINIGRVSDDIKRYNFKVNQFQNLNMGDELVKAVEQQANLAKNLPNYVKNNAELFKTAGIDVKTIKPVTSIDNKTIKEIKKLLEQDIVKRFRNQGIKITNAQAGFITTELLGDIGRVGGKILKGAGVVGTAIEPAFAAMNFSEAIEAGLSGKEAGLYTVGKFGEDVVNIPGILIGAKNYLKDKFTGQGEKAGPFEYLPTKTKFETPYEVTFARDWKEKREDAIPENVKLRRAAEREFDNTIGANMRMVDETEIPASGEEIFTAKDTYLKSQLGENYEVTHPKDVEKEKKADGGLSGVDQYILNRYR
jgi:hypothetical protein